MCCITKKDDGRTVNEEGGGMETNHRESTNPTDRCGASILMSMYGPRLGVLHQLQKMGGWWVRLGEERRRISLGRWHSASTGNFDNWLGMLQLKNPPCADFRLGRQSPFDRQTGLNDSCSDIEPRRRNKATAKSCLKIMSQVPQTKGDDENNDSNGEEGCDGGCRSKYADGYHDKDK